MSRRHSAFRLPVTRLAAHAVLALVVAVGCEHPGRLLVVVGTDYAVPDEVTTIVVRVTHPDGDAGPEFQPKTFTLAAPGAGTKTTFEVPLSFVVTPRGGDSSRSARIAVEARDAHDVIKARSLRIVGSFVRNETRVVAMHLSRSCERVACPDVMSGGVVQERYCAYGACYPALVDASKLPLGTAAGHEKDWLDAELPDAGEPADAGEPPDAGGACVAPGAIVFESAYALPDGRIANDFDLFENGSLALAVTGKKGAAAFVAKVDPWGSRDSPIVWERTLQGSGTTEGFSVVVNPDTMNDDVAVFGAARPLPATWDTGAMVSDSHGEMSAGIFASRLAGGDGAVSPTWGTSYGSVGVLTAEDEPLYDRRIGWSGGSIGIALNASSLGMPMVPTPSGGLVSTSASTGDTGVATWSSASLCRAVVQIDGAGGPTLTSVCASARDRAFAFLSVGGQQVVTMTQFDNVTLTGAVALGTSVWVTGTFDGALSEDPAVLGILSEAPGPDSFIARIDWVAETSRWTVAALKRIDQESPDRMNPTGTLTPTTIAFDESSGIWVGAHFAGRVRVSDVFYNATSGEDALLVQLDAMSLDVLAVAPIHGSGNDRIQAIAFRPMGASGPRGIAAITTEEMWVVLPSCTAFTASCGERTRCTVLSTFSLP